MERESYSPRFMLFRVLFTVCLSGALRPTSGRVRLSSEHWRMSELRCVCTPCLCVGSYVCMCVCIMEYWAQPRRPVHLIIIPWYSCRLWKVLEWFCLNLVCVSLCCSNPHTPCELFSCDSGLLTWLWPSHCQLLLDRSGQCYLWWSKHHLHCHCQLPEWLWGCKSIHPPSKLFSGDTRSPCLCQPHSHTGSRERQWKQQWHCWPVHDFRANWWVSYVAIVWRCIRTYVYMYVHTYILCTYIRM